MIADLVDKIKAGKAAIDTLKKEVEAAENALKLAIEEETKDAYAAKGEPFGTVDVVAGNYKFKVTTPKTVVWDNTFLATMYDKIKAGNENPLDYIGIDYDVSEVKFKAWPEAIKEAFIPGRTVKPGKIKIEIVEE